MPTTRTNDPYARVDAPGTSDPAASEAAKKIFKVLDQRNPAASVEALIDGLQAILPEARARNLQYALLAEVRQAEQTRIQSMALLRHELDTLRSQPPNALHNTQEEARQLELESDAIRRVRTELKRLTALAAEIRPALPNDFQAIADEIRDAVSTAAPRTVIAVAGNVKAGKSTLVNLLLGVPLAAVGQEACSALPIAYVHDSSYAHDAVELHLPESARKVFADLRPLLSQRYALDKSNSVERARGEALMTPQQYAAEALSAEVSMYRPHSVTKGMAVWRGRDAVAVLLPHLHTIARAVLRLKSDENSHDDGLLRAADALRALLPELCPEVRLRFCTLPPVLLDGSEIALVDLPGANEAGTDMSLYLPTTLGAATAIFLVRSASNLAETLDDENVLFPAIVEYGLGKPLHVIFTHGSEMTSRMVDAKVAALAQYQLRVQSTYTVESTFAERAMAFWDIVRAVLAETEGASLSHVFGRPETYDTLRKWCHESRCNELNAVQICNALHTRDANILTAALQHNLAFFRRSGAGALIEAFCSRVHEEAVLAHAMRGGQRITDACARIQRIFTNAGHGNVATILESVQRHEGLLIHLAQFEHLVKELRLKCRATALPSVAAVQRLNTLIADNFTRRRAGTASRTQLALYDWWFDTDPRVALAAAMSEDVTRLCVEHCAAVWTEVARAGRERLNEMDHAGWPWVADCLSSLTDELTIDGCVSFEADDVGTITLALWFLGGLSPQTTTIYEDATSLLAKPASLLSKELLERVDHVHVALKAALNRARLDLAEASTKQHTAAREAENVTKFAGRLADAETAVKSAYTAFNATIKNHIVRNQAAALFLHLNVENDARNGEANLLAVLKAGSLTAKLDQARRKKGPLVLALCGGGMKGLMTVRVLQELELMLRGRKATLTVAKAFDVVYGTSTGAIIAAMLKAGHTLERIAEFYTRSGKDVFKPSMLRWGLFRARYSAEGLQKQAQHALGPNTTMKELHAQHSSPSFKLRVVAFDIDASRPRVFNENDDVPAWQTVRGSSAAPTYFEPMRINNRPYCDGALHMNNPALQALEESPHLLVNVGTGLGGQPQKPYGSGGIGWALAAPDVAMRGHEHAVPEVLQQRMGANYVYLNHEMGEELPSLDDATPAAIEKLEAAARRFIAANSRALETLADRIVADHASR